MPTTKIITVLAKKKIDCVTPVNFESWLRETIPTWSKIRNKIWMKITIEVIKINIILNFLERNCVDLDFFERMSNQNKLIKKFVIAEKISRESQEILN